MAANFPMVRTDNGEWITIISGRTIDSTGHALTFSPGQEATIRFLNKVAPEMITNP